MANLVQIEKHLRDLQLGYKIVDLKNEAYTVGDLVKSGIDQDSVVKTLIVRTADGFVALALSGNDRVDFKKVRSKFGGKSELAKADEVLKVVGVPIGAVCPVLVGIPLFIDKNVMTLTNVHMGSGDLKGGLEMKLDDFLEAVGDYQLDEFSVDNKNPQ